MKNSLGHMPLQLGQFVTENAALDNVNPTSQLCNMTFFRSSSQRCSVKKMFLEISQNSQENTCTRVWWFQGNGDLQLKKRLWDRCFPVKLVKFLGTFFSEHIRTTASVYRKLNLLLITELLMAFPSLEIQRRLNTDRFLYLKIGKGGSRAAATSKMERFVIIVIVTAGSR